MYRRLAVIIFLAGLAGAGLFVLQRSIDAPDETGFIPPVWQTKSRLATVAAAFPPVAALPGQRPRPPADLVAVPRTETAFFALG